MLLNPYRFGAPPAAPVLFDENAFFNSEADSTLFATVTGGSFSEVGGLARFTKTAGTGTPAKAISSLAGGPSTNRDWLVYGKVKASRASNNIAGVIVDNVAGDRYIFLMFGAQSSFLTQSFPGSIAMYAYRSGSENFAVAATGYNYDTTAFEFALHYDSTFQTVTCWTREADGSWLYRARVDCDYIPSPQLRIGTTSNTVAGAYIEFEYLTMCYPNMVSIGGSVCEGKPGFSPNRSLGLTNANSTWQRHAKLYPSLRNNLIVNKGIGSQTSAQIQARILGDAVNHQPRIVFVHVSSNDEASGISLAQHTANIQATLKAIIDAGQLPVLLNGMYATQASADNTPTPDLRDYMQEWWTNYRPTLTGDYVAIDIMEPLKDANGFMDSALTVADGIHPTVAGYQLIGEKIAQTDLGQLPEGSADEYWNETVAMLPGTTDYVDYRYPQRDVAVKGNVKLGTSYVASGALDFTGASGDVVQLDGADGDFAPGIQAFCWEAFVVADPVSPTAYGMLFATTDNGSATGGMFVDYSPQRGLAWAQQNGVQDVVSGGVFPTDGVERHVFVSRTGDGVIALGIDGKIVARKTGVTANIGATSAMMAIGGYPSGTLQNFKGSIRGVRFTVGQYRYTGLVNDDYVPPSLPYGTRDPQPWLPSELPAPLGWYDFSDATKLTMVATKLSAVTDKSSAGRNLTQPTDANRYELTSFNGIQCAKSVSGNFMTFSSAPVFQSNSHYAFGLFRTDTPGILLDAIGSGVNPYLFQAASGSNFYCSLPDGDCLMTVEGNHDQFMDSVAWNANAVRGLMHHNSQTQQYTARGGMSLTRFGGRATTTVSGEICEVFMGNAPLTPQQIKLARTYLHDKWGVNQDPYFGKVEFLLQPNGIDGSTVFTDKSRKARAITSQGAIVASAEGATSPKVVRTSGLGRLTLDQTGISIPSGTDFTLDIRFFLQGPAAGGYHYLVAWLYTGGGIGMRFGDGGFGDRLQWMSNESTAAGVYGNASLTKHTLLNSWHTASLVRRSGRLYAILDNVLQSVASTGAADTSWASTENFTPTNIIHIGGATANAHLFPGFIDTARLTVGRGRYITTHNLRLPYPSN